MPISLLIIATITHINNIGLLLWKYIILQNLQSNQKVFTLLKKSPLPIRHSLLIKKMNINIFKNKKIGLWGFGVVGKSIYDYLQPFHDKIQILDKQLLEHQPNSILQTPLSTQIFLEHNDIVVASPGIPIHSYKQYRHKFITELDIFYQEYKGFSVAITGTVGKTTITNAIAHCTDTGIAAGNIGYAMLNAAMQPSPKKIILELSSFQLQYIEKFAPNIAIFTNFYSNHLDHHASEEEYFKAKCNIFKNQTKNDIAIIPCNLILAIKSHATIQAQIFLTCKEGCATHQYPTFMAQEDRIVLKKTDTAITLLKDLQSSSCFTYEENMIIIIAALYLQNIELAQIAHKLQTIKTGEHRLEKFATHTGSTFYNDSKSTVWQSTKKAIENMNNESCTIFLGGLSKGADRAPLIQYFHNKTISVLSFGKEAELIKALCDKYNVACAPFATLEEAVHACFTKPLTKHILLSPGGSSFDLFKNYQERGNMFKNLIKKQIQNLR